MNLPVTAAFISGVAAVAIQYNPTFDSKLGLATNALWYFSLTCGISATLTGLISLSIVRDH